jgi:hypothetical protein
MHCVGYETQGHAMCGGRCCRYTVNRQYSKVRLRVTRDYSGSEELREPHQRQFTDQGRAAYHSTGLSQRQQRGAWSTTRTHPGQPHPLGTRSVRDSSRPRRSVAATTR